MLTSCYQGKVVQILFAPKVVPLMLHLDELIEVGDFSKILEE